MKVNSILMLLGLVAFAVLLGAPFVGITSISPADILDPAGEAMGAVVFWRIRVPRVLTAFLAGSGLALGGMAFQALFRNPLATPFTLGVSGGAAFGAALYMRLGLAFAYLGISGGTWAAFAGAALVITLVYGLTRARGGFATPTLLLAGVALSFFLSSMILALQYSANLHDSFRLVRWLMGGLGMVGYDAVLNLFPLVVTGTVILFMLTNELNLLTIGEDLAMSRGLDVPRTKKWLFFAVSFMVGGIVAVCGPIGFVGMMAPHICRLLVGADHRHLFPATLLFGGTFLAACDVIARMAFAPAEIPVGVITALLGGPFFLYLLLRRGTLHLFQ
ncbi:MAG: Hemin transport system permease protein HmuU [Candidatus Hydrogenedentes bacterium ADurb.Bin101]|jgi:iron complex transport system permease protein|nr:MAG: Hemin transport system permease protein HmuU [Candidatus Hydrogenedentes bacterium ADurb.Bin101]HOC69261.1 iron ABC transporter permease [Candidatus Hydrogenedentota bacterium]